jgi:hypothetical protein
MLNTKIIIKRNVKMNTNSNAKINQLMASMVLLADLNLDIQKMIDTRSASKNEVRKLVSKIEQVNQEIDPRVFGIDGDGFYHGDDTGLEAKIDYAKQLRDQNTEQIWKMIQETKELGMSLGLAQKFREIS